MAGVSAVGRIADAVRAELKLPYSLLLALQPAICHAQIVRRQARQALRYGGFGRPKRDMLADKRSASG